MHRAKGLEFDTVVLLGLSREPRPDDPKVLQWLGRVAGDGRDDLVMVPATSGDDDTLVDFVRRTERGRNAAERARLLYVATTRARERLHLVWRTPLRGEPAASSMLAQLWPTVGAAAAEEGTAVAATDGADALVPLLRRLATPLGTGSFAAGAGLSTTAARPEFSWAGEAAIHVGTVVHRYLQRFAEEGLDAWTPERVRGLRAAFATELALLGVESRELAAASERVATALVRALGDSGGRWLLGPRAEARSELTLTVRLGSVLEHVRIDRTFVEGGTRWIVDYKTSQHEGGDEEAFLASEVERYTPQLERYARALRSLDGLPVRLCLYFPLLGRLRDWPAPLTESPSE